MRVFDGICSISTYTADRLQTFLHISWNKLLYCDYCEPHTEFNRDFTLFAGCMTWHEHFMAVFGGVGRAIQCTYWFDLFAFVSELHRSEYLAQTHVSV